MSEIAATTAHEAYAFACMRCGHGWEQAFEIEHHVDGSNNAFVIYKADGERVPSPLSRPSCSNCGGHVVRIMRAGRVSTVQQLLHNPQPARPAIEDSAAREGEAVAAVPAGAGHHWHLSDLLHPFHRK
ncbi:MULTISPECIES: hypothetical protein [unclassified Streptomyces]|uniref:hypothetical protein n=1 Tax=unclassified Streptomyces TaxID=2593676 RepID=UPI002E77EE65|nr:hypothetical protein [Streptomyces sp. JV190]MEE1842943.1 hypothetical protein [Streptomyces sp. JV190]